MMAKGRQVDESGASWLGDEPAAEADFRTGEILDRLYAGGPDQEAMDHALAALKDSMEVEMGSMIEYGVAEHTAVGDLFVARSRQGIVAVDMGVLEEVFVRRLRMSFDDPIQRSADLGEILRDFEEYLRGERVSLDLPVDLRGVTLFQRQVLEAAQRVPRGHVATYGEIAAAIGKPKAARAVGQALARNPVPILIPCHRVVAADGALRGYSGGGGLETKAQLLQLEGAL